MKNLRFDYLMMTALVLGGGMAMATRTAPKPDNALVTQWQRVAASPEQEGSWEAFDPNAECEASDKICKANFATGYNPNAHTENENEDAALSGSIEQGYVAQ